MTDGSVALPADIRSLCEKRPGDIYLAGNAGQKAGLAALGIDPASEFHRFYAAVVAINMTSAHSGESLNAVVEDDGEPDPAIAFAWETWGVPQDYLALTSLEGEGGYFYDRASGRVVDFDLADRDAFLAGDVRVLGESFFAFIRWFLSDAD